VCQHCEKLHTIYFRSIRKANESGGDRYDLWNISVVFNIWCRFYVDPREYYIVDYDPTNPDTNTLVDTRELAKPLIGAFIYGPVEAAQWVNPDTGVTEDAPIGFVGFGRRDAFGAVSLDDGVTWKSTNLSESAGESSSDVVRTDIPLFDDLGGSYPGDVVNIFHAVAGNKVLVAWPSRYCESGQPNYSLDNEEPSDDQLARREAIATYLGIDLTTASSEALYLVDVYGVAGNQGSVNYAEEDDYVPNQAVGEVPYNCLWTARGVLNAGDDPRTDNVEEQSFMRWFKAERLTSGVRDVNRIETQCVAGAGCAITWQEDPDGLRGGHGEGPGEGWSGAVANSQTDVWYSYIDWENFDLVQDPRDDEGQFTIITLADYEEAVLDETLDLTQKPKVGIPFAMPMRLTNNARCNIEPVDQATGEVDPSKIKPYCIGEAVEELYSDLLTPPATEYGLKDLCVDTVTVLTGNPEQGNQKESKICVTEDGLPLVGNTAATRPRLNLFGYDSDGDVKKDVVIDSAFALVVLEEDKGLGAFGFEDDFNPDAGACTPDKEVEDCIPFDEGKNIWYFSFSMSSNDIVGGHTEDGLLASLTTQGNILNQLEVAWDEGEFYPVRSTADMWNFESDGGTDYNYDIYNTEIARRGSLLAQNITNVHKDTSSVKAKDGLLALPSWKQGAMNQGGPADVMMRRIVMEKNSNWSLSKDGNPYAFRNMDCDSWAYADGSNPYYPEGVCLDSATNLSAVVPDTCQNSETGILEDCPTVDLTDGTTFGTGTLDPILRGSEIEEPNKTKVLTWHSCPAEFEVVSSTDETIAPVTCDTDARANDSTLTDQSWYNPLDVAKGHRGFLDGDFVMVLYAWSPNWRLNTVGHDRYELYVRRSFDGGETWTTLPNNFTTVDGDKYDGLGTVTCETYRSDQTQASGNLLEPRVCVSYDAGAAEQARNVTQHQSMRITTLDPRYAPTAGTITSDLLGWAPPDYTTDTGAHEDERDPSRFFIVFETGDNTTSAEGEPEPMDLFYSRAVLFGDHYQVWAEEDEIGSAPDTETICYPSNPHGDTDPVTGVPAELIGSGFCNEFDQMEQGIPGLEASEASVTANPGGQFLYATWAEMLHNDAGEMVESDAMVRRVWWIDDYVSDTYGWDFGQGPQDNTVSPARQPKKTK